MKKPDGPADHGVEVLIGTLLRVGVTVAAVIVGAGGIYYLLRHAQTVPRYGVFRGEPSFLEQVGAIAGAAAALRSEAVIQLGLLVLISVPIFRVAVSVFAFLLKRDWLYTLVTLIVLAVLLFALLGGMV